jgi:hypothetical protein
MKIIFEGKIILRLHQSCWRNIDKDLVLEDNKKIMDIINY